jgi:hypothetical protein
MMFFSNENKSLIESCTNGTKRIIHTSRLTELTTSPGCRIISDTFILKSQQIIQKEAEVFERPTQFKWDLIIKNTTIPELEKALDEIQKTQPPGKRHLTQLEAWLKNSSNNFNSHQISFGIAFLSIALSFLILTILIILYIRHRKNRQTNNS